jgi:hypothetical protein
MTILLFLLDVNLPLNRVGTMRVLLVVILGVLTSPSLYALLSADIGTTSFSLQVK